MVGIPRAFAEPVLRQALRDPHDGTGLAELTSDMIRFKGGRRYPCIDARPILIDEATSLFAIADAAEKRTTTQSSAYRDRKHLKNYVRQRLLPSLTWDRVGAARQQRLAPCAAGRPVLVIGAGDRIEQNRDWYPSSTVVTSDVHLQFGADCVLDAHRIPFEDRWFGLIVAAQVLEHTSRPWIVAAEMQRATAIGGVIHIEVPFWFPYHGAPYDFFRFTPTALRFLFSEAKLIELDITEGRFSAAAVSLAAGIVDSFDGRIARQVAVAGTRFGLWWMKYLDAIGASRDRLNSPKGLFATFEVDGIRRTEREMLHEVEALLASRR